MLECCVCKKKDVFGVNEIREAFDVLSMSFGNQKEVEYVCVDCREKEGILI